MHIGKCVACFCVLLAAAGARGQAGDPVTILDSSGVWHALYSWDAPLVAAGGGMVEFRKPAWQACKCTGEGLHYMTQYPPAGWTAADFDDASWTRRHFLIPWANGESDWRAGGGDASPRLRQLSLRGTFTVTDPAAAGALAADLTFRGGAVVYLNGQEIARAFLPAGPVAAGAAAEAYPAQAFLHDERSTWNWWNDRDQIGKECYPLRVRSIESLRIPAKLLRKGTNVLAVELHAAPWPEPFAKGKLSMDWATCGLITLRLHAAGPAGIVPNVVRPAGLQVWNTSTAAEVCDADWADPHDALRPMKLAGPRNGCCSARIAVGSDQPLQKLAAKLGELTGPGGAKLPRTAVEVRYGRFDGRRGSRWGGAIDYGQIPWGDLGVLHDDALLPAAPAEVPVAVRKLSGQQAAERAAAGMPADLVHGAVQTVWLVAQIPADAKAGDYRGTLTVSCDGQPSVEVPVELRVIGWRQPDPADLTYWMGMIESPEAVALVYKTPLWSERHCDLVGRSFEWIGKLGPKVLFLPLGAESQYGNEQSLVLWRRGKDGKLTADLGHVEKYLDLALQHMGKPRFVVCGVWDSCMHVSVPTGLRRDFPRYSVLDEATGRITNADGPKNGSPESLAFWKPVLTAVRDLLARRGLGEAMLLGYRADRAPDKATVEVFRQILPEVGWQATCHPPTGCDWLPAAEAKVPVKYQANVWGGWDNHDPDCRRCYGWRYPANPSLRTWLDRDLFDASPMSHFRIACEQALLADRRGLGQIGADFWPVPGPDGQMTGTMVGRFPATSEGNLGIYSGQLLYPAPDGPEPTARYQMMRENIGECEARIFLERLLTAAPCPLPEALAARCQAVLDERTRWHRAARLAPECVLSWPDSGWEQRAVSLFEAAAEAAKAMAAAQQPA